MKKQYLIIFSLLLFSSNLKAQIWGESDSRTENRDDAGLLGSAGAKSGFYQTYNPINFPGAAPSWWHLLDVRHSNPANNYAMQFAGGFFDQNLYFRKTNNNPSQPWSRVLLETDGKLGVGTNNPLHKLNIAQDVSMNADIDIAQFGITGSSDTRKRIVMGYDTNGDGFGFIKAGFYTQRWTNLTLQPNGGNVGIGTTSPVNALDVHGGTNGDISLLRLNNNEGNYSSGHGASVQFSNQDGREYARVGGYTETNGSGANGYIAFSTRTNEVNSEKMRITSSGAIVIGTQDPKGYKLAVNGSAVATSVTVKLNGAWPDYVFKKEYGLMPLSEIKAFIDQNQHLPEIPSEKEIAEKGLDLGEMNRLLLKKVEELTLYLMQKDKELKKQTEINQKQEERLKKIEQKLN